MVKSQIYASNKILDFYIQYSAPFQIISQGKFWDI